MSSIGQDYTLETGIGEFTGRSGTLYRHMLKRILVSGIKTGAALAVTTSLSIMASSKRDTGNGWNAVNAICHMVDGDDVSTPSGFRPRESLLGLVLNATAMTAWGVLYEGALAVTRSKSNPATAAGASAAAYVIDYHIVPDRLKPGIEKEMAPSGLFMAYTAFALTLALSPLWNQYDDAKTESAHTES